MLSYPSVLSAETRPTVNPKSCVSRRKRAHSPHKQPNLLSVFVALCCFFLNAAFPVCFDKTGTPDHAQYHQMTSSGVLTLAAFVQTYFFSLPHVTLATLHLGSAYKVQCMDMHRKMHPRAFFLSGYAMARTSARDLALLSSIQSTSATSNCASCVNQVLAFLQIRVFRNLKLL